MFTLLSTKGAFAQFENVAIGSWRDHLSYYQTNKMTKVGSRILVTAGSAMFFYNTKDNSVEKFSKVSGLSDAGITNVAYDSVSECIVVVYENSNIDIIQNDKVYNISDIKIRSIEGSKAINNITFYNGKAYLSCGFGIVVLDLLRKEIFETYYIGENSSKINVNNTVIFHDSIYAATASGLLVAPLSSAFLASSSAWQRQASFNSNSDAQVSYLFVFNNRLHAGTITNGAKANMFVYNNSNSWDTIFKDSWFANTLGSYWLKQTGNYLVARSWGTSSTMISVFDTNYNQVCIFDIELRPIMYEGGDVKMIPEFGDAIIEDNTLYLSHKTAGGLIRIDNFQTQTTARSFYPNGPLSNDVCSLTSTGSKIYVAPGGKNAQGELRGLKANIYTFDGTQWTGIENYPIDTLQDVLNVAVDPRDSTHLMLSSWWNGVIEVKNNKIVNVYTSQNTDSVLLSSFYGYRIAGVAYDVSGNLIVANSLVRDGLCYLNYRNQWGSFNTYNKVQDEELVGLTLDRFNTGNLYKFIFTKGNHILALDNNDNQILINPNNGSKDESNNVNCITQDANGELWIGTDKGVKVIYSLDGLFTAGQTGYSSVTCNNVVYEENGIAQYLLNFDNVNCIMCDGGNRKWIGTERNGIFVYSADGDKQLYHFTAENSPLYSDRVISMAQNGATGEVYIGTDRGVISYKSESTTPAQEAGKLTVYPNPVKPSYNGLIAIKGLVDESDVRITDVAGKMVAHLKSVGGQATWNGKDFNGKRVGTGVYLIFASAQEGDQKAVGKILFIH